MTTVSPHNPARRSVENHKSRAERPFVGPLTELFVRCGPWISDSGRTQLAAWFVLAALIVSNLSVFLCMPLTAHTALNDLQALTVRNGGVLDREILERNLPGAVWLRFA